jgi:Tfp pilus assembly protein PilN
MRAVNLIPPEDRRGDAAPARTGQVAYAIIGVLIVAIALVAWMTLLGNQINDSKAEIADIEQDVADSQARATALAPYVSLASVKDARTATIDSLAKSRFDWQRVLRELARVTPEGISLTAVTGTVSPDVTVNSPSEVTLRDGVPGPALEIVGCANSQRDVAEYISALQDIDGVTRVAAQKGTRGEKTDDAATGDAASTETAGGCPRPNQPRIEIVAAFDAMPTPTEPTIGATPATTTSTTATTAATANDGGVGEAQQQQAQHQQEVANASQRANDATDLATGG